MTTEALTMTSTPSVTNTFHPPFQTGTETK